MKKILIILSLIFLVSSALFYYQAQTKNNEKIGTNEISAKNNTEKSIRLPNFSIVDLNGNTHTNNSVKGKYLVVNFWATWCPPCLKEIPAFVEFYEKHADKVQILGLDYEEADKSKIVEFTDTYMVNYPIILFDDVNSKEFKKFGEVFGMPTTYIYNPEGELIDFRMGEMNITDLEKAIF